MTHWLRFRHGNDTGFGTLDDGVITVHEGDMFAATRPTARRLPLDEVALEAPVVPGKIIGLWNNFHALAEKLKSPEPAEPLYFLKAPSSLAAPFARVARPASFAGKIVYEGELGIVIGRRCRAVTAEDAPAFVFGYTCVNDITAADIIGKDATFAQWARAKSYDGFCPVGPVIATGLDPAHFTVRTVLNGAERQNYPVADMIFSPRQIVSLISKDITLEPGDLICCGTSIGAGAMKEPVNTVTVTIDGIGDLTNEVQG